MKKDPVTDSPADFRLSRRKLLGLAAASAATSLVGDLGRRVAMAAPAGPSAQLSSDTAPACVVRPRQTAGPYFVDEVLERSDIRSDPLDGSLKPGTPLRLEFRVSRLDDGSCAPVRGAVVDVWQCDAMGVYSGVRDFNGFFDTRGKRFLRGYQLTDAGGTAQFITVYPGWYPGRTVHIHFKIRTDPEGRRGLEFTSQLYFHDAITDQVHAQAPYASKGPRTTRNGQDGIFRHGGSQLILPITRDGQGYAGTFDIGLQMTA